MFSFLQLAHIDVTQLAALIPGFAGADCQNMKLFLRRQELESAVVVAFDDISCKQP
jgi:hypothetical protein